jgi:uncharacterized membrane protein (UPF0182 family)
MPRLGVLIVLVVIVVLVIFVVVPLAGEAIALYTDWLWFQEVGYASVFETILGAKALLGFLAAVVAFVMLYGNLLLTRRGHGSAAEEAPGVPFPSWSLVEPWYRRLLLSGCLLVGLLLSGWGVAEWQAFIGFRNQVAFGVADPLFGRDVAFYVFTYPLLVASYQFLTMLVAVTFEAVGAIYILSRGVCVTPRGLVVTTWAKRHLLTLATAFLVVKAWGYWLDGYELLFSAGGAVYGAGYTEVNATLPALHVVLGMTGLAAILCLVQMTRPGLRLAAAGLVLWVAGSVLGLTVYPMGVQRLRVVPSEFAAERPYIERTITATNRAYGLDRIEERPYPAREDLTAAVLARNEATIKNTRLWEEGPARDSYAQLQEIRPYYKFVHVDNDRYVMDRELRQVMLSVRELSPGHLPTPTWINEHLVYTHGYGLVAGPVNRASREGLPEFFVKDIPPVTAGSLRITRPEVYYGEVPHAYVVVKTRQKEFDYPVGDRNEETTYTGDGGVGVGSLWRRLLFAVRFGEVKILFSQDFTAESRILYHRQMTERVQKIAPFLHLDRDPYPVVTADGRIVWLLDAYTTSERFPYSQPTPGIGNYIRNPVKVTVDAYHGTVRFYLVEPEEPLARAWARAFPDLFQPVAAMPSDLRAHIRYPQDLFAIQARMYAAFHMRQPLVFYNKEDLWSTAGPPAPPTKSPAQVSAPDGGETAPYYTIMRLPGERREEFTLLLPFTPVGRDNMIAWLAARSDPPHYGKLLLFGFPKGKLVFGPRQIEARVLQDPQIAEQLSLWSQAGSQPIRGGLLAIPIEESFLYIQPLYLAASRGRLPELKRVIVAYGERITMEETLEGSLLKIFANGVVQAAAPATGAAATAPPGTGDRTAQALSHLRLAQEHLRRWDWTGFGEELRKLEEILRGLEQAATPNQEAHPGS